MDEARKNSFFAGAFFRIRSAARKTNIAGVTARKKLGFAAVVNVSMITKNVYDSSVSFLEIFFSSLRYIRIVHSPSHFIIRYVELCQMDDACIPMYLPSESPFI